MAKKVWGGLLAAVLAAGSVHAADFHVSAGAGGFFDAMLQGGKIGNAEQKGGAIGGGIGLWADVTYAELGLDLLFASQKGDLSESDTGSTAVTEFGFSLLGKYPFVFGKVAVFPLVGIDYQMWLSMQMKDKDGKDAGDAMKRADVVEADDYDAFSIGVGAGCDFGITEKLYVRAEFLWNFKLDSKAEADARKAAKDADVDYTLINSGPRLKAGVGFKFL